MSAEFDLPEPSAPEPEDSHRPGPGWALFVLVLGLFVVMQLELYLNRDKDSGHATELRSAETSLRMSYLLREANRRMGNDSRDANGAVRKSVEDLDKLRKSDDRAALLWVTARAAAGVPPKPEELQPLRSSELSEHRTAASILGAEKLTEAESRALARNLPGGFVGRVLKVEAKRKAGVKHPETEEFSATEVFLPLVSITGIMIAAGVGVLLLVAYGSLRSTGRITPRGHPAGELSAADADRFAGKTALLLLGVSLVPFLVRPLLEGMPKPIASGIVAVFVVLTTFFLAKAPIFGKRIPLWKSGWIRRSILKDAGWGVAAAVANIPILLVVAMVSSFAFQGLPPPEHPATVTLTENPTLWTLIATFVSASILAPVLEETIFRGFLVPGLTRVTGGVLGGWIVGGVAFAAIHPTGIPAWLPLAAVGAMAAAVNHQTGSIVSSVTMHAVHNTAILAFSLAVL